ncbi:hypothetical protein BDW72DRAFT_180257, partial [Aspergillus terricola var. indicus]
MQPTTLPLQLWYMHKGDESLWGCWWSWFSIICVVSVSKPFISREIFDAQREPLGVVSNYKLLEAGSWCWNMLTLVLGPEQILGMAFSVLRDYSDGWKNGIQEVMLWV